MNINRTVALLFFIVVSFTFPCVCSSESKKKVYSLKDCIRMVLRFSPEMREKKYDVEIAKTRQDEVDSYQYPQLDLVALLSAVPNARGDQVNSPDKKDVIRGIGPFQSLDVTVVQPLYTFDKITSGQKAAKSGILVEKSRLKQKATDIMLKVIEYYNGYLLARDINRLVSDVRGEINKAKEKIQKLIDMDSDSGDPMDLDKLTAYESQIDKFYFEAEKSEELARAALAGFMGVKDDDEFRLSDDRLELATVELHDYEKYVEFSSKNRPEFKQLEEGLKAKKNLVIVAEADKYPMIFIGANLSIANADGRTDNENPFIYDPLNHFWGGIGLGAKWHFDFGVTQAKVDRARAEYLKLKQTKKYAEMGIPLQVKKAYLELKEAMKNIKSSKSSYKAARRWLVAAVLNFDMGVGEAKDIFEALKIYATTKGQNLQFIYTYKKNSFLPFLKKR